MSVSRRARERRDAVRNAGNAPVGRSGVSQPDGILEDVSARRRSPVLVGRAEHLAALDAALDRACQGGPSTMLIGGEAGVGQNPFGDEVAVTGGAGGGRGPAGGRA